MSERRIASLAQSLIQEFAHETPTDLARQLGVTRPTVYAWRRGQVPHLRHLAALARLHGCDCYDGDYETTCIEHWPAPVASFLADSRACDSCKVRKLAEFSGVVNGKRTL